MTAPLWIPQPVITPGQPYDWELYLQARTDTADLLSGHVISVIAVEGSDLPSITCACGWLGSFYDFTFHVAGVMAALDHERPTASR